MTFILDACALLAFLNDEEGGEKIENILNQSAAGESIVCMSITNLLEVFYGELKEKGPEIAEVVLSVTDAYGVTIIDTVSTPVFRMAAHIKAGYRCSLADAVGLATAVDLSGTFVTSDGELLPMERPGQKHLEFYDKLLFFTGRGRRNGSNASRYNQNDRFFGGDSRSQAASRQFSA